MIDTARDTHAIEIYDVTRSFGDKKAVDSLNLKIPTGTTFGFIGPNGAGKTTTIKMLMGMLEPTSGCARVLGMDPSLREPALRQRVGYVPELHFIYRWMRVGEVIGFCRELYDTWNPLTCGELLELFELDPRMKVKQLSKGMTAKLALLLAISHEPELLILDEPTSGLDPLVREEFLDGVLRSLCVRSQTVLFSSHTLSDVQRLADHVGLIYNGRLLVHCPTEELLTGTKRVRAVLKDGAVPADPPDGTIWQQHKNREWLLTVRGCSEATLETIRGSGCVDLVEVTNLSLEDVFKDYVKGRRASA
jgi:ABC-2 type transport system ATP-binding protein